MQTKVVFLDRATIPQHIDFKTMEVDHSWVNYEATSAEQVVQYAKNADIIITNKVLISAQTIKNLPKLKHIAVIATGYNNIDIEACKEKGISVSNTPEYASTSVSEHTLAMIFSLKHHLFAYRDRLQGGHWQKSPYFHAYLGQTLDIKGSRLGIIGGGNLGNATAKLAEAVGMDVVFAERKGDNEKSRQKRQGYLSFDEVIKTSDIISLHCPLTESTRNLIGLKELQAMKPSALLINTARGGIVNEADLATALENKLIAGAGFDVASVEPIETDNPLLRVIEHPNFILTPHVAWSSDSALRCQADIVVDNIKHFIQDKPYNKVV